LPGLAIFLAVSAFNLIGEGVRDALDPRNQGDGERSAFITSDQKRKLSPMPRRGAAMALAVARRHVERACVGGEVLVGERLRLEHADAADGGELLRVQGRRAGSEHHRGVDRAHAVAAREQGAGENIEEALNEKVEYDGAGTSAGKLGSLVVSG